MQQLKILVGVLTSVLFVLAGVMVVVHGAAPDKWAMPEPLWLGLVVAVALGSVAFVQLTGFRVPPLEPTDLPHSPATHAKAVAALQQSTISRFAVTEAVGIVGIVASFVTAGGGALTLVFIALGLCLALMLWQVWPSAANVRRVESSLNRNGASFSFTEAGPSGPGEIPGRTRL